jgi:hypothetical protein
MDALAVLDYDIADVGDAVYLLEVFPDEEDEGGKQKEWQ